ncbi:hypothetical protein BESB_046350 [Besnoitia besnoiti]|uniref:Uncharacterized protein n=1 Tax=Besnoitia besnoiti TaxID=94643 RepID=A0A2A9ML82_BESBE|nr:hypothetical protein BESB_046350 [Besnoitia besnoiti]PFH36443.1 hypothetical protein BESB_046350 [Besnoitia besnoiti]
MAKRPEEDEPDSSSSPSPRKRKRLRPLEPSLAQSPYSVSLAASSSFASPALPSDASLSSSPSLSSSSSLLSPSIPSSFCMSALCSNREGGSRREEQRRDGNEGVSPLLRPSGGARHDDSQLFSPSSDPGVSTFSEETGENAGLEEGAEVDTTCSPACRTRARRPPVSSSSASSTCLPDSAVSAQTCASLLAGVWQPHLAAFPSQRRARLLLKRLAASGRSCLAGPVSLRVSSASSASPCSPLAAAASEASAVADACAREGEPQHAMGYPPCVLLHGVPSVSRDAAAFFFLSQLYSTRVAPLLAPSSGKGGTPAGAVERRGVPAASPSSPPAAAASPSLTPASAWIVRRNRFFTQLHGPSLNVASYSPESWRTLRALILQVPLEARRSRGLFSAASPQSSERRCGLRSSRPAASSRARFPRATLFIEDIDQVAPSLQRRLAALLLRMQQRTSSRGAPAATAVAWLLTASHPHLVAPALRGSCAAVRLPLPSACELAGCVAGRGEAGHARPSAGGERKPGADAREWAKEARAQAGDVTVGRSARAEKTEKQESPSREERGTRTQSSYHAESDAEDDSEGTRAGLNPASASSSSRCRASSAALHLLARAQDLCPLSVYLSLLRAERGDASAGALLEKLASLASRPPLERDAAGECCKAECKNEEKDDECVPERAEAGGEKLAANGEEGADGLQRETHRASCPFWSRESTEGSLASSSLVASLCGEDVRRPVNERIRKIAHLIRSSKCCSRSPQVLRRLWQSALQHDNLFRTRDADAILLDLRRALLDSSEPDKVFSAELVHLLADTSFEIARGEFALGVTPSLELLSLRASRLYHASRLRREASEAQSESEAGAEGGKEARDAAAGPGAAAEALEGAERFCREETQSGAGRESASAAEKSIEGSGETGDRGTCSLHRPNASTSCEANVGVSLFDSDE